MTRAVASAGRRIAVVLGMWGLATGCVYYNGVYNAQAAAKQGDRRLRENQEAEAQARFLESAERAESVLVRFPTSKWRTRALYLAGRGHALSGDCERGRERILELLDRTDVTPIERDRARVALGACDVRSNAMATARLRLDSLIDSRDSEVAREARLWAARAALTMGDLDAVTGYLGASSGEILPWELISASTTARDFARSESLLVLRARRGDYRDEALRSVREMAAAGRVDGARRVVLAYDAARVREPLRAQLHYTLGDQLLRVDRDSLAAWHLGTARELAGRDTLVVREAVARTAWLALRRAQTLEESDAILAQLDSGVMRTAFARRVADQWLLVRMLAGKADGTGAGQFLAAEVLRDSLQAPALAQAVFVDLARRSASSPLAPAALYAATLLPSPLTADSADRWRRRVTTEYAASAVAARLRGDDPSGLPDFVTAPEMLRFSWSEVTRQWADSVRRLRTARGGS